MLSLIKLAEACCEKNLDAARELLDQESVRQNLNEPVYKQVLSVKNDESLVDKTSVAHVACWKSTVDILEGLLSSGAQVNVNDGAGNLPIHYACCSQVDAFEKVKALVNHDATNVYSQGFNRCTPLHVACARGQPEVVILLLDHGAKTDVVDSCGDLPIHDAARSENEPLAKVTALLDVEETGVINTQNKRQETPLIKACRSHHYDVALLLLERGATKDVKDTDDKSALEYLSWHPKQDDATKTELYLKLGGVAFDDAKNKSLLLDLSGNTGAKCVEIALRHGADVDVTDSEGETALHKAASHALTANIDTLLTWGSDVNKQNKSGDTPLHAASSKGLKDAVQALTSHALADIFTRNAKNQTPLDVAKAKSANDEADANHAAIIQLLNDFVANPEHLLERKLGRIESNLDYLKRSLSDVIDQGSQSAHDAGGDSQQLQLQHKVEQLERQSRSKASALGRLEADMQERISQLESQNLRLKQQLTQQERLERRSMEAISALEKQMVRLHNKTQQELDHLHRDIQGAKLKHRRIVQQYDGTYHTRRFQTFRRQLLVQVMSFRLRLLVQVKSFRRQLLVQVTSFRRWLLVQVTSFRRRCGRSST